ncbi:DUF4145 domain-containing protein [Streptomyces sp. NPDC006265]|uniref:DUF4145 domain-containing protein n=1 Tax=Streptomyces sp. NPDC006265 TaxID=3156740 RepID=UPI0033AF5365
MNNHPQTRCGWCQHDTVMMPVEHQPIIQQRRSSGRDYHDAPGDLGWAIFTCAGCGAASLSHGFYPELGRPGKLYMHDFMPLNWYPQAPLVKDYPDSVPPAIAKVAAEAHGSMSVGHHQAAVLMARTTVEAVAKAQGITQGNLVAKIDGLYNQHLVYEHVRDAAHEVRFIGNDAAHADLVDNPISEEEASAILELMDMVLDGVFIAPAKTAAQRAARLAKKAAASGPTAASTP